MKLQGKKSISLFLVLPLLIISCTTTPYMYIDIDEKRFEQGIELEIWGNDGQFIKGELIAVKRNSLLLLESGADVIIDIKDVKVIKIKQKSKFLKGAAFGFLIGGVTGAFICALGGDDPPDALLSMRWEEKALFGGIFFGLLGGLGGGLIRTALGDKTIQIEGMTDSEIQETLDFLRKKARVPNYK